MNNFVEFLKKYFPSEKQLGGFFTGEKVLYIASKEHFIYVCGDFVSASKLKRGLDAVGKKVKIISCGRENEDEHDFNLFPFAQDLTKFINCELDGLIFLPSSLTTKFDIEFLKKNITLSINQEYDLNQLSQMLTDFGFERVDYVSIQGQFAIRGDVVDIFVSGQDYPTRLEFFDDEIEKIINFDFSTMKTEKNLESITILPIYLKTGENTIFDLSQNIFIDEPIKIENECKILKQSREQLSWNKNDLFLDFENIDLSNYVVFSNMNKNAFENKTIGQKSYITDFMELKKDIEIFKKGNLNIFLFCGEYYEILREFLMTSKINFKDFQLELMICIKIVKSSLEEVNKIFLIYLKSVILLYIHFMELVDVKI